MGAWLKRVILFQSLYYLISGLWPLVSIQSFMAVTGPKTDLWLVYMVGLLAIVIGAALLFYSLYGKGEMSGAFSILGIGAAISFAFIDVKYASKGIIWNTYLIDAGIQFVLILLWIVLLLKEH